MDKEYVPNDMSKVPESDKQEDEQCAAGGTNGAAKRVTRNISRKAVEDQSKSDTKTKKPRMSDIECNQQEPELDDKKAQNERNELGLKKNEFLTLPTVITSRICLFHNHLDIVNFAMCHSKFEDTCLYELRMRKLRLTQVDLSAIEVNKVAAPCDNVEAKFRNKFHSFGDGIQFCWLYDRFLPGSATKREVDADKLKAMKRMAEVVSILIQNCDISELTLCIKSRMNKSLRESERLDVVLAEYFGKDEYSQDEKIAVKEITVTPGTVSCLRWFSSRKINYSTNNYNYKYFSEHGDTLLALIDDVDRLTLAEMYEFGDSRVLGRVSVDNIMEKCRVPKIYIGFARWSESSFRRVLTEHAKGTGGRRTIEVLRNFRDIWVDWVKRFDDWQELVGSDVAVRDGKPRITLDWDSNRFGVMMDVFTLH